jgi:predicted ABC-type ATPase
MVAGPNGAGKTTLVRTLRQTGVEFGEYINPDDIACELLGSYDDRVRQAQVIADRRREACIEAGHSFSFETVMSHPSKIDILARAKAAGFFVQLFFVGIDDPQTNSNASGYGLRRADTTYPVTRSCRAGTARWRCCPER